MKPAVQLTWHIPPEHTWPAEHARPHIPQCALSVARSRHVPEHAVCPDGHDTTHEPD